MARERSGELLLGEWACLGALYPAPLHGFAVAALLRPGGEIGRVWSMSRALTYRALDQLVAQGYVEAIGEEHGIAGGMRTILRVTRRGRAALRAWVVEPVAHVRDVRSELLLKLVLAGRCGLDSRPLLVAQREVLRSLVVALGAPDGGDVVARWRAESVTAAQRFVDALLSEG